MLANKYRPGKFVDLVGQEVLVETVRNSIALNRVANAFLLTGSHGIGKTSSARIIAMSVNCENYLQEPCGECESCKRIKQSSHPDIVEIDAASNTGVDDIRGIIENSCYLPVSAKYRIYIIDEVHMLSNSAFNALLKLLEEPPEHIKFIFATTEKRKLPLTIISRCQHFALKRLSIDSLIKHLFSILMQENVEAKRDAVKMIANFAGGSVRDALSLLDQVISYSQDAHIITTDKVREVFGISDKSQLLEIIEHLLNSEVNLALSAFKNLYDSGNEPVLALQHILELLHLLIRVKLNAQYESAEYSENVIQKAHLLAPSLSLEFLNRAWQVLAKGLEEVNLTPNYYMATEILLIRISCLSNMPSPAEIIKNLRSIENTQSHSEKNLQINHEDNVVSKNAQNKDYVVAAKVDDDINIDDKEKSHTKHKVSGSYEDGAISGSDEGEICIKTVSVDAINDIPVNFDELILLCRQKNQMIMSCYLRSNVTLIDFREGCIKLQTNDEVVKDYINSSLARYLKNWTKKYWKIVIKYSARGADDKNTDLEFESLLNLDIMRTIMELFGCSVEDIKLVGKNGKY